MTHDREGRILDVGRRTRIVPPSLRRALEARDRGCRFPGCGLRFTDAHHVRHWADGGETSLKNLVLLCRKHHRTVHEGGARVCMDKEQRIVFFDPKGRAVTDAPGRGPVDAPGRALAEAPVRGPVDAPGRAVTDAPVRAPADVPVGAPTDTRGPAQADARRRAMTDGRRFRGNVGALSGGLGTSRTRAPTSDGPSRLRPSGWDGSSRWKRDAEVPWEIEARVIDALDT